jgi:RNA polymerase sporulation-specific sigma factor
MRKLTEKDIYIHYMPLVLQECKNSYKGLEWEDRIAEAGAALIYAIRTYRTSYGSFPEYMISQLKRILQQKNSEAWSVKKLDSRFSLDAPLYEGDNTFTLISCITSNLTDESALDVKCFLNSLTLTEKNIIKLLVDDYNIATIANILNQSLSQIQSTLNCIKNKYTGYFRDDSRTSCSSGIQLECNHNKNQ